ncbi:hypothetical protein SNO30_004092 [Cronobacter sakazakii]|uniref:hypothetical protein n=1 Tax=Cronobacter sakazakii TaxID=28141 RepID=UPI000CFD73BD|nr:hypothetical protein [Cronobacter sakazakii]ELY3709575.1 hypothetical protein [Cronobacter sakazakii]ELY4661075.1 hypothetical protein [Cronobacter sakazakii]ELY5846653.1 hypothetical protein [Cronobacter sakazakii]ELY5861159.1 hypothetical protein [Cronobacter sakazakii]ELY6169733.1 hypothetical protein [Cronobacter sakazakii]
MKKIVALLICMACTGCFDKSNDQIKSDALVAVKGSIGEYNRPEPCDSLVKKKAALGPSVGAELAALCGNEFDLSKPISLSDFEVRDSNRQVACGFVSGTSQEGSNLKSRFVYLGKSGGIVIMQPALSGYMQGEVPKVISQQQELYQRTFNENCT